MKRTKLFDYVLQAVANETEVDASFIVSNKRASEIVDSRMMLVMLLYDIGFGGGYIANKLHRTEKGIKYLAEMAIWRLKQNKLFRRSYEEIKKQIASNESMLGI